MQRKAPLIPPPRSTLAKALQPDYRKWEAVRIGMTRAEVTGLLGEPLTGREQRPISSFDANYLRYGFVSYPALPHKWEMCFVLGIDKDDRVWWKCDPFGGGPISRSGKPSKPRMIAPQDGSHFAHFPRLLDVRWYPSSGVYPLVYELEFSLSSPGSDDYRAHLDPHQYGQPYAVISFPGAQPGRIRVRGRNANGVGPWSDDVGFAFHT